MSSKEYIVDSMYKLVEAFPSAKVRYDYHLLSKTHTLEVVPNEIYHFNKDYKTWEETLIFDFIDKFPKESLSLVTDNSLFGIDKVDFELIGSNYFSKSPTVTFGDSFGTTLVSSLLPNFSDKLFTNFHPELLKSTYCKIIFPTQEFITFNSEYFGLEIPQSHFVASYHEFHSNVINQQPGFKEIEDKNLVLAA